MKPIALTLALLAIAACTAPAKRRLEQTRDEAVVALRRGELVASQSLAERGLALSEAQHDSVWTWTFRLLRAESLVLQQKLTETRTALTDPLPQAAEFDSLRARQKYLQARAYVTQGQLLEALDTLDQGRKVASVRDVQSDLDVLRGELCLRLGRAAEAESLLQSVVAASAAAGDHYHQGLALNNLGMGRLVRNRYDDALQWFERVLSLTDLESFRVYAASLSNAGICFTQLGDFDRAIALQQRAVRIFEGAGSPHDFGQTLGELGRTYLEQGRAGQALPYLQRSFNVARDAHLSVDAALSASSLAEAEIELGHWEQAERSNDEAVRIRRSIKTGRMMHNTANAAKIAVGQGRKDDARQLFEAAVAASADEPDVWWDANAGLARLSLADGDLDRAADYFDRALTILERTGAGLLKTDYKLSYVHSLIRFYQEYVDALIKAGRTDSALEVADSSRARILAERERTTSPGRIGVARFRRAAALTGRPMLFYWLEPTRSYLWVVTASEIQCVRLPGSETIETLVREHHATIQSSLADSLSNQETPGDRLYRALVSPAARWIPNGASIVIVPDGALHGLNFETLPVGGSRRHYWIEDVEIEIVPSLGLLTTSLEAGGQSQRQGPMGSVSPQSLLLVGAPSLSDPAFPTLRYAAAEMRMVAGHFDPGRVVSYDGARATPAAYRDAHPGDFSMVHFTAHAETNVDSPLDSAVILATRDGTYKLYARDVAEQPLQAELVTVSACRGAGARAYSGEGLIGFAWAFLRAGARRVIAGLWDVDDRSTADLMDGLYRRLASGDRPAHALREAKLDMIKRGGMAAKPYYWGPFELFAVAP
jgi:CHAT domain-containing protein/Tfp pilus assembly protein PilF